MRENGGRIALETATITGSMGGTSLQHLQHSYAWWPTLAVLAIATFTDIRSRRIPNWLVFPFLLGGLVVSTWIAGWHGLGQSLLGLTIGGLIYGVLAMMGGMGMGDVKLCAAIGAWIWWQQLVLALVLIAVAGGIMAVAWAICGGFLGEMFSGTGDLLFGWRKRGLHTPSDLKLSNPKARKMPYAPAIAIGTLISFFSH
jgi:prepilin peptidase CpaA